MFFSDLMGTSGQVYMILLKALCMCCIVSFGVILTASCFSCKIMKYAFTFNIHFFRLFVTFSLLRYVGI